LLIVSKNQKARMSGFGSWRFDGRPTVGSADARCRGASPPPREVERIGLPNQLAQSAGSREAAVEMGQMNAKKDACMVQGIK
jgi:hypothetical protein